MDWQLHWLEAESDLSPWREQIAKEVAATHAIVSRLVTPPQLDILVQRLAGAVIPEIGMTGTTYRKGLMALTLDPDNPHFTESLANGALRRTAAHEVHHCLRMAGRGYGHTLGEALVSEGLAGHFIRRLFGNPPEPWECAVDDDVLHVQLPDAETLGAKWYNHAEWFFGAGGRRPRWLGYTLGYRVVGDWLAATPDADGDTLVSVPAETVLTGVEGPRVRKRTVRNENTGRIPTIST
jgi:uncharacterized protein YjaZ